jgi:hypothetical protein
VHNAHRTVCRVDVLPALPAGAAGFDAQVYFVDLDFDLF